MEEIVKTTRYWLFKKTETGNLYYVRVKSDGNTFLYWSLGYKNIGGLVSLIGGELDYTLSNSLENEFQEELNKIRKEMIDYKIKI